MEQRIVNGEVTMVDNNATLDSAIRSDTGFRDHLSEEGKVGERISSGKASRSCIKPLYLRMRSYFRHIDLFGLVTVVSLIVAAISGSVVSHSS